jgi:hypothetical protein
VSARDTQASPEFRTRPNNLYNSCFHLQNLHSLLQVKFPDVAAISDVSDVELLASISVVFLTSSKYSKAISEHTTSGPSLRSAWPPRFSGRRMPRMNTLYHRDSCDIVSHTLKILELLRLLFRYLCILLTCIHAPRRRSTMEVLWHGYCHQQLLASGFLLRRLPV